MRVYEVKLDHGFRKYFNTMMRRAKVNYLDKEDMMGHTTGLEKNYERYNEEDFERFSEYEKAIPFLTVSDAERLRLENTGQSRRISEMQNAQEAEIAGLKRMVKELAERMETVSGVGKAPEPRSS